MGIFTDFLQKINELMGIDEEYEEEDDTNINPDESEDTRKTEPIQKQAIFSRNIRPNQEISQKPESAAIAIFAPVSYNDCKELGAKVKEGTAVIVDYNNTTTDVARQIFHFMHGLTFALGGSMEKIGTNIFLYTPKTIGIADRKTVMTSLENTLQMPWGQ